jgi:hypothetical protein
LRLRGPPKVSHAVAAVEVPQDPNMKEFVHRVVPWTEFMELKNAAANAAATFFFAQVDDVLEHPSPEGSLQDESSNGSAMRRSLCGSHDKSLVARTSICHAACHIDAGDRLPGRILRAPGGKSPDG